MLNGSGDRFGHILNVQKRTDSGGHDNDDVWAEVAMSYLESQSPGEINVTPDDQLGMSRLFPAQSFVALPKSIMQRFITIASTF
jgi:hypothetical protein